MSNNLTTSTTITTTTNNVTSSTNNRPTYSQLSSIQLPTPSLDFRTDTLETPQITRFNHENIFGASFRETLEIPVPALNDNTNTVINTNGNITNTTNFLLANQNENPLTASSTSSSSSNASTFQFMRQLSTTNNNNNDLNGSKNAPKKNLLLRTISQNDNNLDTIKINHNHQQYQDSLKSNGDIIKRKQSEEILLFNIKNVTEQQQPQQLLKDDKTNKIDIISIPVNSFKDARLKIKDIKSPIQIKKILDSQQNNQDIQLVQQQGVLNKLFTDNDESNSSKSPSTPIEFENQKKKRRSIMATSDARRQQIRNSNREAARRCRERRRQYIESLEQNIQNLEGRQKKLSDENSTLRQEIQFLQKQLLLHKECPITLSNNQQQHHQRYISAIAQQDNKMIPILLLASSSNNLSNINENITKNND